MLSKFFYSGEASGLGLRLLGVGWMEKNSRSMQERRILDAYALVWVTKGSGVFTSASSARSEVVAGDAFLLFPGEWHIYGPGQHWTEYWAIFEGELPRTLQELDVLNPSRPLYHPGVSAADEASFSAILRSAQEADTAKEDLVPEFYRVLNGLLRNGKTEPASASGIQQLAVAVRRGPQKPWDLRAEARRMGMGVTTLRRGFKDQTGVPFHRFLLERRMELARRWLAEKKRVKEVCRLVGFADPFHFSRVFRATTGFSPRQYMKSVDSWHRIAR